MVRNSTNEVFDRIAPGWYNFRHRSIFTTELTELAGRWQRGKLLNLGCAHGPDFVPFSPGFALYGVDLSREMLKLAQRYARKFDFSASLVLADVGGLPFADRSFDWAVAVATYHHLKGRKRQEAALAELWRVLKPGGEALITVWNRWQRRFWLKPKELAVPWRSRGETLERYYYLFSYPEIERLVAKAGFTLIRSFPESAYRYPLKFFSRNICLLVRK
jgi:tRNA (uracil-5-)-methyltransferase TRM9